MENHNYDALASQLDSYEPSKLRGLVSENSAIGYAAYVLDKTAPPNGATMLDLGCGDGLMMNSMLMLRLHSHINGIE